MDINRNKIRCILNKKTDSIMNEIELIRNMLTDKKLAFEKYNEVSWSKIYMLTQYIEELNINSSEVNKIIFDNYIDYFCKITNIKRDDIKVNYNYYPKSAIKYKDSIYINIMDKTVTDADKEIEHIKESIKKLEKENVKNTNYFKNVKSFEDYLNLMDVPKKKRLYIGMIDSISKNNRYRENFKYWNEYILESIRNNNITIEEKNKEIVVLNESKDKFNNLINNYKFKTRKGEDIVLW